MRDGRPNPDIWGNILTCGEIAMGIYQIIGTKKQGIQMPKEIAEEILPESALTQAESDGDDLCFTDPLSISRPIAIPHRPSPCFRKLLYMANRALLSLTVTRPTKSPLSPSFMASGTSGSRALRTMFPTT